MLRTWTIVALGAALAAQEPPKGAEAAKTAADAVRELEKEFADAHKVWMEEMRAYSAKAKAAKEAREAGREPEPLPEQPVDPGAAFLPRYVAAAKEHRGQEAVFPILQWIVQNDHHGTHAKEALAQIVADHVTSERLARFVGNLHFNVRALGSETLRKALTTIADRTASDEVEAAALLARANVAANRFANAHPTEAELAGARADLQRVIELAANSATTRSAEGFLFELDRLQIGMVAPDIEGEDVFGSPMKLSGFRGTVLMLDFWGHW